MFGEIDLINDLTEKSLANWCTIQLLCNVATCDIWMVLVWRNCVHSVAKLSLCQTFPLYGIACC